MVLDIQNHTMMIISSDSFDLQPEFVDSIYSNPGERFDFVINAYQPNGELEIFYLSQTFTI